MFFKSDNTSGVHPQISRGLALAASGFADAYGGSSLDAKVTRKFCEIFEKEVAVFFVGTGTAANSLALASIARPGGVVFCHDSAHVFQDECGAPDFFSSMRLVPVGGGAGQIDSRSLTKAMDAYPPNGIHHGRAAAVTLTQATESGTIYSLDAIEAISREARKRGVPLHMDGARFANALAAIGSSPAEMTWRRGVDILSFGGTKNGCWCAEAIVFFHPEHASETEFLRKRGAQLFSKSRFLAAQFDAYLADGLWLDLAQHANGMADLLRKKLADSPARLAWPTVTNEVFAVLPRGIANRALEQGAQFYDWPCPAGLEFPMQNSDALIRLVTSFATTEEQVSEFITILCS